MRVLPWGPPWGGLTKASTTCSSIEPSDQAEFPENHPRIVFRAFFGLEREPPQ
jgi:hypothetical protein